MADDEQEHYFSADPTVAFKRAPVTADVWGTRLELASGSGVFAQGRVDVGTAILFRETDPPEGADQPLRRSAQGRRSRVAHRLPLVERMHAGARPARR